MTAVYPSLTALANQEFLATHDTGCTTEMCTPLCRQASQFAQLPTGMIDTDRITAAYTATPTRRTVSPTEKYPGKNAPGSVTSASVKR